MNIVSDAGPLIALAKTGYLSILKDLFKKVLIPPMVFDELCIQAPRPGSKALSNAHKAERSRSHRAHTQVDSSYTRIS